MVGRLKDIPPNAVIGIALIVVGAFSTVCVLAGRNGQLISATYAIIGLLVGYAIKEKVDAKKKEKTETKEPERL
jgi:hypothetical protein